MYVGLYTVYIIINIITLFNVGIFHYNMAQTVYQNLGEDAQVDQQH